MRDIPAFRPLPEGSVLGRPDPRVTFSQKKGHHPWILAVTISVLAWGALVYAIFF